MRRISLVASAITIRFLTKRDIGKVDALNNHEFASDVDRELDN